MRLLPRRRPGATLRIAPDRPVRPTDTITATVVLDDAVEGVAVARLELGYDNTYNYRWAGKHSHASLDDDPFSVGTAGTDHGSHRDATDWVRVLDVPLPLVGGRLERGEHAVLLRVPSWAPGSSSSTVAWQVRLRVERPGRDVRAEAAFDVVVPPASGPDAPVFTAERLEGASSDVAFAPDRDWWRPGEAVRGVVHITARDVDLVGDVDVRLQRFRASHPLVRTPGPGQLLERPLRSEPARLHLPSGVPTTLPFDLPVPDDAPPSTETVHSSIAWFVGVRIRYEGQVGHVPDAVRRGIGVFTG